MKLVISTKSQKPIYKQLYEQISAEILSGELPADSILPSFRGVAKELGISIITVKSAYEALERDGFIYMIAGKGCFVARHEQANLSERKEEVAICQLKKELPFYRNLGLDVKELKELIDKLY